VFGALRDHVTDWMSDRWKSFIDSLSDKRNILADKGPDIDS
jgi:hypothetical protein